MSKRNNVISWSTYFMGIAHLSALRSKDPNTQVGAVIVDDEHKVVSIGYNGFPRGISDDAYPWGREGELLESKYPYVVHAELNAILNAPRSIKNCTLYVSLFPCHECAKALIQAGIKEIVYESDKYADTNSTKASRRMCIDAGLKLTQSSEIVELSIKTKAI